MLLWPRPWLWSPQGSSFILCFFFPSCSAFCFSGSVYLSFLLEILLKALFFSPPAPRPLFLSILSLSLGPFWEPLWSPWPPFSPPMWMGQPLVAKHPGFDLSVGGVHCFSGAHVFLSSGLLCCSRSALLAFVQHVRPSGAEERFPPPLF